MAKQSGIHQLKGKVGEMSYYQSTGVSGGLVRRINQGLSARVKGGAEYANTRLNNQEFAAAANVAGLLGKMVVPKFRPMILPFSQSKMAKEILKVAREHTQNWGQRVVTSEDTEKLCAILSSMSKRDYTEFCSLSITRETVSEAVLYAAVTSAQGSLMYSLGINSLTVNAIQFDLATGQWSPFAGEMLTGYLLRENSATPFDNESIEDGTSLTNNETLDVAEFVPEANHSGHQIVVFVVLPAREVNGATHILQEYCSFVAMPLPAVSGD